MDRHHGVVLVDANVIIEAYRNEVGAALAGGYQIETVEACVSETQTGFQRRRPEQQIDLSDLRDSLNAIHKPSSRDRLLMTTKHSHIWLDEGEASLWTHALDRTDDWVLSGPDKASLKLGCELGFRHRLVSMVRLLKGIGVKPPLTLRGAYTQSWHERLLTTVVL